MKSKMLIRKNQSIGISYVAVRGVIADLMIYVRVGKLDKREIPVIPV